MKVIIDTNGLMIPVQFGVDIFEELKRLEFDEFLVPEAVVSEIEMLIKRERGLDKMAAKVAKSMLDRCKRITARGPADDVILKLAEEMQAAVLTNDIKLKQKLVENGVRVITLRQKNRLEIS